MNRGISPLKRERKLNLLLMVVSFLRKEALRRVISVYVSYHEREVEFSPQPLSYRAVYLAATAAFSILTAQTLNSGILATGSSADMVSWLVGLSAK